ncbi:MAG: hypothetical protein EOP04_10805 [Proteobacteria bacterium]|nr:MAG: hypothetical protein EOP04_10805 [Pseudomonadota bacterium]
MFIRFKRICKTQFCKKCGNSLWIHDPDYLELMHPFASAIDTDRPLAPEHTHMMLGSKASWVRVSAIYDGDYFFREFGIRSLECHCGFFLRTDSRFIRSGQRVI